LLGPPAALGGRPRPLGLRPLAPRARDAGGLLPGVREPLLGLGGRPLAQAGGLAFDILERRERRLELRLEVAADGGRNAGGSPEAIEKSAQRSHPAFLLRWAAYTAIPST